MLAGQGSATGSRALRRLGRGGDEVNEKPTPSPHFISLKRQPKGPFRYYSEFEPASPPAIQILSIKMKIKIILKKLKLKLLYKLYLII